MRKFNVTVNGKTYEVEVEELVSMTTGDPIAVTSARAVAPPPAQKPVEKKAAPAPEAAPAPAAGGGEEVTCPMPGTILGVNIKPGDTVKNGDVLFILEAMKMENEIMAPRDAKVSAVNAIKGASVNTGDVLAVLE